MVIFHSYAKLPEGRWDGYQCGWGENNYASLARNGLMNYQLATESHKKVAQYIYNVEPRKLCKLV
jgi:hypothetical protein